MSVQNYTPLDDLANGQSSSAASGLSYHKESEPLAPARESVDLSEVQEVVEHEPQDEEVKEFVEVKKDVPEIPEEVKKAGVESTAAVQFPSYQTIQLPLSDDKVIVGQKAPLTSSLRWLSTLAMFILWQAHATLKLIQGKPTRVMKK